MAGLVWKVMATGSTIVAGIVATKEADAVWRAAGQEKVADVRHPDTSTGTALAYAALTGIAAGVARTLAQRKATAYYAQSTGHLPHDIEAKAQPS